MSTPPVAQSGPYSWGDQMKTSLFGRRSGLDINDFNIGGLGSRDPVEIWNAGSTGTGTGSTAILSAGGISVLEASTASTFQLPAPSMFYGGVGKTIQFASTGGGNMEIDTVSGNFQTSASSTYSKITFSTTGTVLNGGLFLQCVPLGTSTAWVWALNGSTGVAGGGSSHIAFS